MFVLVAMAEGTHPFPSRTRKLSPLAPMVLPWRRGGRVGNCQVFFKVSVSNSWDFFLCLATCRFAGWADLGRPRNAFGFRKLPGFF